MVKPVKAVVELAPLIGEMTIAWNDCQSTVFIMFNDMLGTTVGRARGIFFAVKSDTGQRDITLGLANVALALHPELLTRLRAAFSTFNSIAGRRNDFIHAIWHNPVGTEEVRVWLDVRRRLSDKDPVTECRELLKEIRALFTALVELHVDVAKALAPPPSLLEELAAEPPGQ